MHTLSCMCYLPLDIRRQKLHSLLEIIPTLVVSIRLHKESPYRSRRVQGTQQRQSCNHSSYTHQGKGISSDNSGDGPQKFTWTRQTKSPKISTPPLALLTDYFPVKWRSSVTTRSSQSDIIATPAPALHNTPLAPVTYSDMK